MIGAVEIFHKPRSANRGDEVIECEKARVHRAVLLGLPGSRADYSKLIAYETEKWGKVTRAANIKPE